RLAGSRTAVTQDGIEIACADAEDRVRRRRPRVVYEVADVIGRLYDAAPDNERVGEQIAAHLVGAEGDDIWPPGASVGSLSGARLQLAPEVGPHGTRMMVS